MPPVRRALESGARPSTHTRRTRARAVSGRDAATTRTVGTVGVLKSGAPVPEMYSDQPSGTRPASRRSRVIPTRDAAIVPILAMDRAVTIVLLGPMGCSNARPYCTRIATCSTECIGLSLGVSVMVAHTLHFAVV